MIKPNVSKPKNNKCDMLYTFRATQIVPRIELTPIFGYMDYNIIQFTIKASMILKLVKDRPL